MEETIIENDNTCSICWDKSDYNYYTTCNHSFHKKCIDKWLENNNTCPICRTIIKQNKPININAVAPIDVNQQNIIVPRRTYIFQKTIFIILLSCGFVIANIYNMIIFFMLDTYIYKYYNNRPSNSGLITLFILITIFLLMFGFVNIITIQSNGCMTGIMIIFYIILTLVNSENYKYIFYNFDILSIALKINLIISMSLYIIFNSATILVTLLKCCYNHS
jgi:hypothetical protein